MQMNEKEANGSLWIIVKICFMEYTCICQKGKTIQIPDFVVGCCVMFGESTRSKSEYLTS